MYVGFLMQKTLHQALRELLMEPRFETKKPQYRLRDNSRLAGIPIPLYMQVIRCF